MLVRGAKLALQLKEYASARLIAEVILAVQDNCNHSNHPAGASAGTASASPKVNKSSALAHKVILLANTATATPAVL